MSLRLFCPSCGWEGTPEEAADDGPSYPFCCPLCGCSDLIEERDEVGEDIEQEGTPRGAFPASDG